MKREREREIYKGEIRGREGEEREISIEEIDRKRGRIKKGETEKEREIERNL